MNDLAVINGLKQLGEIIRKEVERVLTEQGHVLTGKIFDEVDNIVKAIKDGYILEGHYQPYSIFVHKGVKAERIPYSPGSGRRHSKYIEALKQYARHRGMSEPDRAAFAIARVHKREGMPTKASSRFSQTGERLKFLDYALKDEKVDVKVEKIMADAIEMIVNNILSEQQKKAREKVA